MPKPTSSSRPETPSPTFSRRPASLRSLLAHARGLADVDCGLSISVDELTIV